MFVIYIASGICDLCALVANTMYLKHSTPFGLRCRATRTMHKLDMERNNKLGSTLSSRLHGTSRAMPLQHMGPNPLLRQCSSSRLLWAM